MPQHGKDETEMVGIQAGHETAHIFETTPPKRELTDWDREFIPPDEAIEWRDNGVYDARVAAKARQACLSPSDMKIKFDGVPVGQRLANGESIASVKARLREREAGTG